MIAFKNTYRLAKALVAISKFNYVNSSYHRRSRKEILATTSALGIGRENELPANALMKMQWYMAEFLFVSDQLCQLIGHKSNQKEKAAFMHCGALLAACDMVIDDVELDGTTLRSLQSEQFNDVKGDAMVLYKACFRKFFNSLPEPGKQEALQFYRLLFEAQIRSKRQFDPNITAEEVNEICIDKGGYSMLVLRSLVPQHMEEAEHEIWFDLGAFIQYCNDAQDLHKDLAKEMKTFASVRPNLEAIASDLVSYRNNLFPRIKHSRFAENRKDDFLYLLFVMSEGILIKLKAFDRLCQGNFSYDKFSTIRKEKVRAATSSINLLRMGFGKNLNYSYQNIL